MKPTSRPRVWCHLCRRLVSVHDGKYVSHTPGGTFRFCPLSLKEAPHEKLQGPDPPRPRRIQRV